MDFKAGKIVVTPLSDTVIKYEDKDRVESPFDMRLETKNTGII